MPTLRRRLQLPRGDGGFWVEVLTSGFCSIGTFATNTV